MVLGGGLLTIWGEKVKALLHGIQQNKIQVFKELSISKIKTIKELKENFRAMLI